MRVDSAECQLSDCKLMKNLILHIEQIKSGEIHRQFEVDPRTLPIIAEMIKSRACEFCEPLKIRIRAFKIRELYEVEGYFQTRIRIGCSRCL